MAMTDDEPEEDTKEYLEGDESIMLACSIIDRSPDEVGHLAYEDYIWGTLLLLYSVNSRASSNLFS